MSATRASGANRTSARGGWATETPRSRVIGPEEGSFRLSEAVWNLPLWFFTSTAPIRPARNNSATAPTVADHASVRGDRLANNSETRADRLTDNDGLRAGSASIAANSLAMARDDGAPRLSLR